MRRVLADARRIDWASDESVAGAAGCKNSIGCVEMDVITGQQVRQTDHDVHLTGAVRCLGKPN